MATPSRVGRSSVCVSSSASSRSHSSAAIHPVPAEVCDEERASASNSWSRTGNHEFGSEERDE